MASAFVAAISLIGNGYMESELQAAKKIAVEAGRQILEVRESDEIDCKQVFEHGKTTLRSSADIRASDYVIQQLTALYPDHAVLTQDASLMAGEWYEKEFIWIVNPLDGTAEFNEGGNQFGVQIGLVYRGESILGVNYFPVSGICYWGIKGKGAWREKDGVAEKVITKPSADIVLLKSSGLDKIKPLFEKIVPKIILDVPNSGGRVFSIMDGGFPFPLEARPTLYVSTGAMPQGTKKGSIWNYAATDVIAREAGTIMTDLSGRPLNFLEKSTLLPRGVVVTSDPRLHAQVIDYFKPDFDTAETPKTFEMDHSNLSDKAQ